MKVELFSVRQTAEKLGISRQRVHQLIEAGKLGCEWVGKYRIITSEQIKSYKNRR